MSMRTRSIREQCDKCRHYTGIGTNGVRHSRIEDRRLEDIDNTREGRGWCAAGVYYNDVKKTGARMITLPCFPSEPDNMPADGVWPTCAKASFKTPEELDAEAAEIEAMFDRSIKRITVVIPAIQQHAGWTPDPRDDDEIPLGERGVKREGKSGEMPCPICDTGTLAYSICGYKGHIHARCSTEDCVSFMQ